MKKLLTILFTFSFFFLFAGIAQADNIWVDSGNVGIGTTNPNTQLDVRNAVQVANTDYVLGSAGSALQIGLGAASGNTYAFLDNYVGGGTGFGNIVFHPTGNGNVGIGITNPTNKLYILGGASNASNLAESKSLASLYIQPKYTSGYGLAFGSGPADFPYIQQVTIGGEAAGNMLLQPYGGNIGIGTTNPGANLDVRNAVQVANTDYVLGSAGSALQIGLGAASGNTYAFLDNYVGGGTGFGNIVFHPTGNGNVGIGTTDPTEKLQVEGNIKINGHITSDGDICIGAC